MKPAEVHGFAEPLLRSLFGEAIEGIKVRADEDWSGTPSLYIDVFLVPGTGAPDPEAWATLRRTLSDTLVGSGEGRFPYLQLRDRREEAEDAPDEAA